MYAFCQGAFFTGLLVLCIMAAIGTTLTFNTPMVIWTAGTGIGLLAGAIKNA